MEKTDNVRAATVPGQNEYFERPISSSFLRACVKQFLEDRMADQNCELIESVRVRSVLYDTNHKDYLKTKVKQRVWEEVAKETNFKNGAEAKEKWEKLRHSLRDALRRQKKSGAEAKLWRYQKQMEFLQPFSSNWDQEIPTAPSSFPYFPPSSASSSHLDNSDESLNDNCDDRRTADFEDEPPKGGMNNYQQAAYSNSRGGGRDSSPDPLYYFFLAMYETAKRMPPKNQINVRNNLFHLIVNEENAIKNGD